MGKFKRQKALKGAAASKLSRARASRSTVGPIATPANLALHVKNGVEAKGSGKLMIHAERATRPPLKYSAKLVTFTCLCRREHAAADGVVLQCSCGRRWVKRVSVP